MPKYVTTNGRRCIHMCSIMPGRTLAKRRNADFLLRQSTGYCVAEHNGGCCPRNTATGIASTNDLPAGAIMVFWRICINILLATTLSQGVLHDHFVKQALAAIPAAPVLTSRQAARKEFDGLTERERQVAVLIAQGKSNREIAEMLVVTVRTVEAHITRVLDK